MPTPCSSCWCSPRRTSVRCCSIFAGTGRRSPACSEPEAAGGPTASFSGRRTIRRPGPPTPVRGGRVRRDPRPHARRRSCSAFGLPPRRLAARPPPPRRLGRRPAARAASAGGRSRAARRRAHGRGRRPRARRAAAARGRRPHQAVQPEQAHRPARRDARRLGRGGDGAVSVWAAILAGGSGTRFWPLSTPERPKQLLPLAGDRPLLAQAVARLRGLVPREHDVLVTVGVKPTRNETGYGYIVPGKPLGSARAVRRFVEKPTAGRAALLRRRGALWNTGLFAWGVPRFLGEAGAYAQELK